MSEIEKLLNEHEDLPFELIMVEDTSYGELHNYLELQTDYEASGIDINGITKNCESKDEMVSLTNYLSEKHKNITKVMSVEY